MPIFRNFRKDQSITDWAYLAGIIDGEGCFYIGQVTYKEKNKSPNFHSIIAISNNEKSLIDWLDKIFGKASDNRYKYQSKRLNEKPTYRWSTSGQLLDYILPRIYPFLVIKRKQCKIMIEIRKTFKFNGPKILSDDIQKERFRLMIEMRKLNSRFHNHPLKQ